jgi:hypothetical protein
VFVQAFQRLKGRGAPHPTVGVTRHADNAHVCTRFVGPLL